ncbi:MAG: alpha-ketoacid dehydrogenase subunit beta [Herpetosiphon sp.]
MEMTLLEAIRVGLDEAMAADERVFIFGEDVGRRGGVFRVTEGLLDKYGEARVVDAPLAEAIIVGACIGAACYGLRPVAEIQFADYIWPAANQIISEAARMRYRSNNAWGVPLVIRAPYGGGIHGALYHSQCIEAFFAHVPGLKVVAPSTPYDAKALIKAAIEDPDPVLFLEHKKAYRLIKGDVPEGPYQVPIGKADVKRQGTDLTIISYGLTLHLALEASNILAAEEGIEAEVVDLRTIVPLDRETVLASVRKTGKALIIHEDNLTGGFGAEIAAIIAEHAFEYLDGPVMRLAGPDIPAMPFAATLEHEYVLTAEQILEKLHAVAAY